MSSAIRAISDRIAAMGAHAGRNRRKKNSSYQRTEKHFPVHPPPPPPSASLPRNAYCYLAQVRGEAAFDVVDVVVNDEWVVIRRYCGKLRTKYAGKCVLRIDRHTHTLCDLLTTTQF